MTRRAFTSGLALIPSGLLLAKDPVTDDMIYDFVRRRLTADREVKIIGLEVEVKEGVVTLRGEVATEKIRQRAEKVAKKAKGVKSVVNELRVRQ